MKFLVVLVAVVAYAKGWDLKCGLDRFLFQGSPGDFTWDAVDIQIGGCTLGAGYVLNATYVECGVKTVDEVDLLLMQSALISRPITSIITRKTPIEYAIGCTFNKQTQTSAVTAFDPIVGQIGGLVSRTGKAMQFTMTYKDTEAKTGEALKIPVGQDVEVLISGPELEGLGLYAQISDCFATPSADADDATKYPLLSKMCIKDPDVSITRVGFNQILKFKSFAFTKHVTSMVYLHCDVFACTTEKRCGYCMKDWKSISEKWIDDWKNRVRIAMVFEPNTIQTLKISNLRCTKNGIKFQGKQEDFPVWAPEDIKIGTCPLNKDFYLLATYVECGIGIKERRHQLLMQTFITGKPTTDDVIQRKRPIKYMLRCGYDRFARISTDQALAAILPVPMSKGTFTNRPDMFLNLLDNRGYKLSRATLGVDMNQKVVAVIGGKDVSSLNMRLHAVNCFVTPTSDASGNIKYDLLSDSCPVDSTFQAEAYGSGQRISFNAFAFTHDHSSQLYLHCDVTACLENAACGVCANHVTRRKRSAYLSWNQRIVASGSIHVQ